MLRLIGSKRRYAPPHTCRINGVQKVCAAAFFSNLLHVIRIKRQVVAKIVSVFTDDGKRAKKIDIIFGKPVLQSPEALVRATI